MSISIRGGNSPQQEVNVTDKRLWVDSEAQSVSAFQSRSGLTFNTVAIDAGGVAGDFILYFKNTSTTHKFYVDLIRVGSAATALWKVWEVTGTASGTSLTPFNMNLQSGVTATATVVGGTAAITGLTGSSLIATARHPANADKDILFNDTLILGTNDAIGVELDTSAGAIVEVLMRGYFREDD